MKIKTVLFGIVAMAALSSCASLDLRRSELSKSERHTFPYWEQADSIVGADLRFSDLWCELAYRDRGRVVIQISSDSDWEISDRYFERDTTITRELIMGGEIVYPTYHYKVLFVENEIQD